MIRTALATLGLVLALSASAFAQGAGCLSGGPDAVKVDAFPVNLTFGATASQYQYPSVNESPSLDGSSGGGMKATPTNKASGCQVLVDITVWSIQGRPAISISNGTVNCVGDPAAMGDMSAAQLFRMLTQAAIGKAVARGDIACTPDCGGTVVQVIQPACVSRELSADGMVFKTCDVYACCIKSYMVCCPDGSGTPVIREVESRSSGCAVSGCESTCQ